MTDRKKFTEQELQERLKKGKQLTREEFIKRIHEASERKTKSQVTGFCVLFFERSYFFSNAPHLNSSSSRWSSLFMVQSMCSIGSSMSSFLQRRHNPGFFTRSCIDLVAIIIIKTVDIFHSKKLLIQSGKYAFEVQTAKLYFFRIN